MKKVLLSVFGVASLLILHAQDKIKDGSVSGSSSTPVSGAVLELESNNKALLLPRVSILSTTAWGLNGTAPTTGGYTIYNTNESITQGSTAYPTLSGGIGVYYWDGAGWVATKYSAYVEPWNQAGTSTPATSNGQAIYQNGAVSIWRNKVFESTASGSAKVDLHVSGATRIGSAAEDPDVAKKVGYRSFAGGNKPVASGVNTIAYGETVEASGDNAVAFGQGTTASGNQSIAGGTNTKAGGEYSVAFGYGTEASGLVSAAFGNGSKATNNTAFATGWANTASGIGSGVYSGLDNTVSNSYAAVLGGTNNVVSGKSSVAVGGTENTVSGQNAFATGANNSVASNHSAALGNNNSIDAGSTAFAIGGGNTIGANSDYSFALGQGAKIKGGTADNSKNSYAIGYNANVGEASGLGANSAYAIGSMASAQGKYSYAIGFQSQATAYGAIAIGSQGNTQNTVSTVAQGKNSVAIGTGMRAEYDNNTAIGAYNLKSTDARFAVGIGTTDITRRNGLMVFDNGKTAIGYYDTPGIPTFGSETLLVKGSIKTASNTYADYVFEDYFTGNSTLNPDYKFKTIYETERFIKENKHLPGVTSIKDLEKTAEGYSFNLTDLSTQTLEKVEELYLHTIEQQKLIDSQKQTIDTLQDTLKSITERLNKLENNK